MFSPASVGRAQAGERRHRDAFGAAEVDKLLLVQVRVALDLEERSRAAASVSRLWWGHLLPVYLVGGRLVFETRLVEEGLNLVFVEVGDADGLDQPVIHQLLHSLRHGRLVSRLGPSHSQWSLKSEPSTFPT